ncbi:hypothetical protein [Deinococcus roseus]|uniref:Uncharacterized protein n=1 Tax=Deinococcus roseus TaxID=392414 RepID=A0ABQ2D6U1_9DEIO|nr:hypothetical protein [Deinococcus roseus]GGJ48117.1 hypothetical protein GCM10008938_37670 [Deinococcus roseus]
MTRNGAPKRGTDSRMELPITTQLRTLLTTQPTRPPSPKETALLQQIHHRRAVSLQVAQSAMDPTTLQFLVEERYLVIFPTVLGLAVALGFSGRKAIGHTKHQSFVGLEVAVRSIYQQDVLRMLLEKGAQLQRYTPVKPSEVQLHGQLYLLLTHPRGMRSPKILKCLNEHRNWLLQNQAKIMLVQPNQRTSQYVQKHLSDVFVCLDHRLPLTTITKVPTSVKL